MRIKGIDFRYGFGKYDIKDDDESGLAREFSNDQNNYYRFDNAKISANSGKAISDIYLGVVLVPSYYIKNKLFFREEFRFGLSFTILNNASNINLNWDTVQTGQQKEIRNMYYQYKYNSQRLHFSYLLNSKIFKNNLAFFSGLGASFGFSTWRTSYEGGSGSYKREILTLQNNQLSNRSQLLPLENFSTASGSLYVPVGIKYNLSCDINLFAEAHFGLQYYMKGLRKDNTWIPNIMLNFGFRYKLIDDEMLAKNTDAFW